jgi:hypothetical protein
MIDPLPLTHHEQSQTRREHSIALHAPHQFTASRASVFLDPAPALTSVAAHGGCWGRWVCLPFRDRDTDISQRYCTAQGPLI